MQQIVYQQATPTNQIHTDGSIQYIVQEDDTANETYSVVQQSSQPIYYTKVATENGSQLVHHGTWHSCIAFPSKSFDFHIQKYNENVSMISFLCILFI